MTAIECSGDLYRIDGENGFDVYTKQELTEKFNVIGIIKGTVTKIILTPKNQA